MGFAAPIPVRRLGHNAHCGLFVFIGVAMRTTLIALVAFLGGIFAGEKVIPYIQGSSQVTVTGPAMLIPLLPESKRETTLPDIPAKPLPEAKEIFNYEPNDKDDNSASEAQSTSPVIR
jgi:hypothetical protein